MDPVRPVVSIKTSRFVAAKGVDVLSPARFPMPVDWDFDQLRGDQIRSSRLELLANLRPGVHTVRFTRDLALEIDVRDGSTAGVLIETGTRSAAESPEVSCAIAENIDIHFDHPLVIRNVFGAIRGAGSLFENVEVKVFLTRLLSTAGKLANDVAQAATAAGERFGLVKWLVDSATNAVPEVAGLAKKSFDRLANSLMQRVGEPFSLEISAVRFRPAEPPPDAGISCPILVPSISGAIFVTATGARARFDDIEVPSLFLPRFHSTMNEILSGDVMVGGALKKDNIGLSGLALDIAGMLGEFGGKMTADVVLPCIRGSWRQADRSDVSAEIWTAEPLARLAADFKVRKDGDDAVVDIRSLSLGAFDSSRPFTCQASLTIKSLLRGGLSFPESVDGMIRQKNRGSLPVTYLKVQGRNPFLKSGNEMLMRIDQLKGSGAVKFSVSGTRKPTFELPDGQISFATVFSLPEQCFGPVSGADIFGGISRGSLKLTVSSLPDNGFDVLLSGKFPANFRVVTELRTTPELDILPGRLDLSARATVDADIGATVMLPGPGTSGISIVPHGKVGVTVGGARVQTPRRSLKSMPLLSISGVVREGVLAIGGEGDVAVDLNWDFDSREIEILHKGRKEVHTLPLKFARGVQTLHVSPGGRLSLTGSGHSILRPEIAAALTSPINNLGGLLGLLNDETLLDETLGTLAEIMALFNPTFATRLMSVKDWVLAARRHVIEVGIEKPGDMFEQSLLIRLISRVIVGDESIVNDIEPLVRKLNAGQGFDVTAAGMLVLRHRPDIKADYEVQMILKWLDIMTTPIGNFQAPVAEQMPPTVEDPALAPLIAHIPTASNIYDWFDGRPIDPEWVDRTLEFAPLMYLDQLEYVMHGLRGAAFNHERARLQYTISVKRAINGAVNPGAIGDIHIFPRASVLGGFIGDLTGPIDGIDNDHPDTPAAAPLGPKDIADILEVGLASPIQGVQTQLNNRMALEFLKHRDGDFLIAVMSELSRDVAVTLAVNLMGFFRMEQGRMDNPIDIEAFFEEKTGLKAPRFEDFEAGGLRARESYFEELHALAVRIIAMGAPYRAAKLRLRETVAPRPVARVRRDVLGRAVKAARQAIATADQVTGEYLAAERHAAQDRRQCMKAWDSAFAACREVLAIDPRAFHQPWFKEFWVRHENAVRVAVCVRGFQQNLDRFRDWLVVYDDTGAAARLADSARTADFTVTSFADEQALVDAFISALWSRPDDRALIAGDPLVRVLPDPPTGDYDLTIVGAMGVITDGACGREMETAFERLEKYRGIKLRRVPTGLFRTLEYNARAIIKVVDEVQGPWAFIGYSQGCANGLRAEHIMMTGTPQLRAMADRLVCRNLVFSAANGSVHATSGTHAFVRMLGEAEKSLKHYQGQFSRDFVAIFQKATRGLLDSRVMTGAIGGLWSMTLERAVELHRNGVFSDTVPTSTIRGVATLRELPDGLNYVYGVHRRLMPGQDTDSQVATVDEVGHATRVRNARTEVLAACDMGCMPIKMHHWGPIHDEAQAGMSDADERLHKYDCPADIYVFPWIDTNIRFGLIKPRVK